MAGYSFREFKDLLTEDGWYMSHRKSSHVIFEKDGFLNHISVPDRKEICRPMAKRLLKQAGILH